MIYYNEDIKMDFIINQEYRFLDLGGGLFLSNILAQSAKYEKILDKDLYEFTREEILNFYIMLRSSSVYYLSSVHMVVKSYINWCIDEYYSNRKRNPARLLKEEDLKKCISPLARKKAILTEEEILVMSNSLSLNPSDQYILLAPFYGINGKELCELSSVKREDIDEDNCEVNLCTNRTITVPEKLIKIMLKSLDTYTLYVKSVKSDMREIRLIGDGVYKLAENSKEREYCTLVKSKKKAITYRFTKIKNMCDMPELTLTSVKTSGFIHFCREDMKKYNMDFKTFMLNECSKEVCEKFDISRDPYRVIQRYKKFF